MTALTRALVPLLALAVVTAAIAHRRSALTPEERAIADEPETGPSVTLADIERMKAQIAQPRTVWPAAEWRSVHGSDPIGWRC